MYSQEEIEVIKNFINKNKKSTIYLGVDSQRLRKKRVKYATVVVIHYIDKNGIGKGAKVFSDVIYHNTKDSNLSKPFNRMMKEVELVTNLYKQLEDILIEREFEIHIDVNPSKTAGSNVAYNAAKWTIFGEIGVEPVCKPEAWCASCAADRWSK